MNNLPEIAIGTAPPEYEDSDEPHYDALERTGFFGEQAAGSVVIAADTGRLMLPLRSAKVLEPGTYGNFGGAHHADEDPETAARRELREETGWQGPILAVIPAFIFRSGSFIYRNFFTVVPCEFTPELGWEADSHVWVEPGDLPTPLHFGMKALLVDDEASRNIAAGGWREHLEPSCDQPAVNAQQAEACDDDAFIITVEGADMPDDATIDRIYESGCDDALVSFQKGALQVTFTREGDLRDAAASALRDVKVAGLVPIAIARCDGKDEPNFAGLIR